MCVVKISEDPEDTFWYGQVWAQTSDIMHVKVPKDYISNILIMIEHLILWHADPLLDSDRKIRNGSTNKHVSMATTALQQRNGVFYAVRADML
jgi:hypothetical protein